MSSLPQELSHRKGELPLLNTPLWERHGSITSDDLLTKDRDVCVCVCVAACVCGCVCVCVCLCVTVCAAPSRKAWKPQQRFGNDSKAPRVPDFMCLMLLVVNYSFLMFLK